MCKSFADIKGGWSSICGSRLGAAHMRCTKLQELHGLRAGRFQNVVLAFAPRTLVFNIRKSLMG
eukprot:5995396-Pyramimonas_sp.AAC.1